MHGHTNATFTVGKVQDRAAVHLGEPGELAWRAQAGELVLALGVGACRCPPFGRQRPKTRAVSRPKPLFRGGRRGAGGMKPAPPRDIRAWLPFRNVSLRQFVSNCPRLIFR
jgi:hypothetical protein